MSGILILFCICFLLLFNSCDKNGEIVSAGILGLESVGKPRESLGLFNSYIQRYYSKHKKFPDANLLLKYKNINSPNIILVFYSYTNKFYQIAYWTGETTWIYDFETNTFFEFKEDISSVSWYDTLKKEFITKEETANKDIIYNSLLGK